MRRVPLASSSRLSTRYAAKKIDEQHLRGLAGLEVERPDADPEARAVDRLADAGEQREQQRDDAEEQERVAVALERADVAHDDERERRTRRRRAAIHPAWTRARSGSRREIVTKPMPLSSAASGQERGIGVGRERADREVRDDVEADHRRRRTATGRAGRSGWSASCTSR